MFNFYKIWLQRTTAVLLSMIVCSLLKQMLNASLTFFLKKKKMFSLGFLSEESPGLP